jgi:hypothetical protein
MTATSVLADHPKRGPDGERGGLPQAAGDRDVGHSGEVAGNRFDVGCSCCQVAGGFGRRLA